MYVRIITDLKYALITRDYSNLKMIYIDLNKKCSYQEKLASLNFLPKLPKYMFTYRKITRADKSVQKD